MGRICNESEDEREWIEGNLAMLGNAIVLLELAMGRVETAAQISRQSAILEPAKDDLCRAKSLILRVQCLLAGAAKSRMQQEKNS
jgi:hypothetical protein